MAKLSAVSLSVQYRTRSFKRTEQVNYSISNVRNFYKYDGPQGPQASKPSWERRTHVRLELWALMELVWVQCKRVLPLSRCWRNWWWYVSLICERRKKFQVLSCSFSNEEHFLFFTKSNTTPISVPSYFLSCASQHHKNKVTLAAAGTGSIRHNFQAHCRMARTLACQVSLQIAP